MADSKVIIANKALSLVASGQITSFLQANSNEATAINLVYQSVLEEVLAEHPWSFAQKRVALTNTVPADTSRTINGRIFTPVAITGATAANPVVITAADHGLANGDRIKITGITGMTELNGNFYRVADKTADTFELVNEDTYADIDGSSFTAYTSGGQVQLANNGNPVPIEGATVADPVVITSTAHGLSDDDWIKIIGVNGMTDLNNTFFIVDDATANTFSLNDTDGNDVDGSAYSAWTFGGIILAAPEMVATENMTPIVYDKPSDYVKITGKAVKDAIIFVEQDKIISDTASLKIKYTFLNEDTTQYFPKFTEALASRLAAEIAYTITHSRTKQAELMDFYRKTSLPTAQGVDSQQSMPKEAMQDEWLDSRILGKTVARENIWHEV